MPFSEDVISNDLEWLSELFNETKHRAASLQQLSFLSVHGSAKWHRHSVRSRIHDIIHYSTRAGGDGMNIRKTIITLTIIAVTLSHRRLSGVSILRDWRALHYVNFRGKYKPGISGFKFNTNPWSLMQNPPLIKTGDFWFQFWHTLLVFNAQIGIYSAPKSLTPGIYDAP